MLAYPKYVGEKIAQTAIGITSGDEAGAAIMDATGALANGFVNVVSPVRTQGSEASEAAFSVFPSLLKPFADLTANKNFFGTPIYNEQFDKTRAQSALGREATGSFYKWIAKSLNDATGGADTVPGFVDFQPERYKYLVENFGGGTYRTMRDTANLFGPRTDGETGVQTIPAVRNFVGKGAEFAPMNHYFDNTSKMQSIVWAAGHSDEPGWAAVQQKFPLETSSTILQTYYAANNELERISKARLAALAEASNAKERQDVIVAARSMSMDVYKAYNQIYNETKRQLHH